MILYGAELKRLRKLKRISRRELARRTGYNYITITKIENGESMGKITTMYELFEAIGYILVPLDKNFSAEN